MICNSPDTFFYHQFRLNWINISSWLISTCDFIQICNVFLKKKIWFFESTVHPLLNFRKNHQKIFNRSSRNWNRILQAIKGMKKFLKSVYYYSSYKHVCVFPCLSFPPTYMVRWKTQTSQTCTDMFRHGLFLMLGSWNLDHMFIMLIRDHMRIFVNISFRREPLGGLKVGGMVPKGAIL